MDEEVNDEPMTEATRTSDSELLALVYERLRRMAERQMAGERGNHTLGATGLVHEAWVNLNDRLDDLKGDPARFYGAATEAMRRILIDHARRRGAQKRGGGLDRLSLDLVDVAKSASLDEVLSLDAAVAALAEDSPRSAEVVRLRFYTGLGEEEVAQVLGLSVRTIRREWAFARAWLFRFLENA